MRHLSAWLFEEIKGVECFYHLFLIFCNCCFVSRAAYLTGEEEEEMVEPFKLAVHPLELHKLDQQIDPKLLGMVPWSGVKCLKCSLLPSVAYFLFLPCKYSFIGLYIKILNFLFDYL